MKKLIVLLIAAVILLGMSTVPAYASQTEESTALKGDRIAEGDVDGDDGDPYIPPAALLGDVDGDRSVTIIDATVIQRRLANVSTPKYNEAAADTDRDGFVTVLDATYIQKWLAGLKQDDNIGKPITK